MDFHKIVFSAFVDSRYRRAAERAGFTFGQLYVSPESTAERVFVRGVFTCVCGRSEYYSVAFSKSELAAGVVDPALVLYMHGSFSKQHLLDDGYSEQQATQISSLIADDLLA